jgi:hypothetical protein
MPQLGMGYCVEFSGSVAVGTGQCSGRYLSHSHDLDSPALMLELYASHLHLAVTH